MDDELDDEFYDRADAHINLSNAQLENARRGIVSASMMYAAARFNAWVSATGFQSSGDMANRRDQTLEYFTSEYRKMLADNLDDYIARFDERIKPTATS